jgi:biopolymer transport protein ExbD
MARHKSFQQEADAGPGLDISSLIDVCFLLLIYFLVATTIQKSEQDMPLKLPTPPEVELNRPDLEPLLIKVDARGVIYAGAEPHTRMLDEDESAREVPLLSEWLQTYAQSTRSYGKEPAVIISLDREVRQQRAMDVLNALAGAQISMVTLSDPGDKVD